MAVIKKRCCFYFYLTNFFTHHFKSFVCVHIYYVCFHFTAVYDVVRNRGNFGDVSVSWVVSPDFTQDVFPVQGTVVFGDQEFSKNITIYSLPDEVNIAYNFLPYLL